MRVLRTLVVIAALLTPVSLHAASPGELVQIMNDLKEQNLEASLQIRALYTDFLNLLVIDGYSDLEAALGNGGVVPLPSDPARYNITLRTAGDHPIAEKDLVNQGSYLTARTATIGCLLEIGRAHV